MSITELEVRVATLERKLAALSGGAGSESPANINAWIDQIHGTFQDDPTYRQGARLGRQWRKSTRGGKTSRQQKASAK
jgi:hypothetical protein